MYDGKKTSLTLAFHSRELSCDIAPALLSCAPAVTRHWDRRLQRASGKCQLLTSICHGWTRNPGPFGSLHFAEISVRRSLTACEKKKIGLTGCTERSEKKSWNWPIDDFEIENFLKICQHFGKWSEAGTFKSALDIYRPNGRKSVENGAESRKRNASVR